MYEHAFYGVLITTYGIGLPISFSFGVIYWESLNGLWFGCMIAMAAVSIFFIYLGYFQYDWDKIAAKVNEKHTEKQ